jgi:hypothetical protein
MNSFTPRPITLFPELVSGIVDREISTQRSGIVRHSGCLWQASPYSPYQDGVFSIDDKVSIAGRQGNTLLVLPYQHPETPWHCARCVHNPFGKR